MSHGASHLVELAEHCSTVCISQNCYRLIIQPIIFFIGSTNTGVANEGLGSIGLIEPGLPGPMAIHPSEGCGEQPHR